VDVIRPTGISSRSRQAGGVPITTTRALVVEFLAGRRLRPVIGIRQLGSASVSGCGPLVQTGRDYIAFLRSVRPQARSGAFWAVGGGQGLFESQRERGTTTRADASFVQLGGSGGLGTRKVALDDVRRVVRTKASR
jgi:hypothetical protein